MLSLTVDSTQLLLNALKQDALQCDKNQVGRPCRTWITKGLPLHFS